MDTQHTSSQIRGISASVATLQINRRCSSFSRDSTCAEGAVAATEGEAATVSAAYTWVAAAAAAAAAAAMMAGRLRPPGAQWHPHPSSCGWSSLYSCSPSGYRTSSGIYSYSSGARTPPPGPKQPPPALVDILPGAPSQLPALVAAFTCGLLVPGAIAAAPGGWAERPRSTRRVPALRSRMRGAPSPLPPKTGHVMVVCLAGRGAAPALALCMLPSAPAPACAPAPPTAALASAPALLSILSSFWSAFAPGSGRKSPGKAD